MNKAPSPRPEPALLQRPLKPPQRSEIYRTLGEAATTLQHMVFTQDMPDMEAAAILDLVLDELKQARQHFHTLNKFNIVP